MVKGYLCQVWCDWQSLRGLYREKTKTILNNVSQFNLRWLKVIYVQFDAIGSP